MAAALCDVSPHIGDCAAHSDEIIDNQIVLIGIDLSIEQRLVSHAMITAGSRVTDAIDFPPMLSISSARLTAPSVFDVFNHPCWSKAACC